MLSAVMIIAHHCGCGESTKKVHTILLIQKYFVMSSSSYTIEDARADAQREVEYLSRDQIFSVDSCNEVLKLSPTHVHDISSATRMLRVAESCLYGDIVALRQDIDCLSSSSLSLSPSSSSNMISSPTMNERDALKRPTDRMQTSSISVLKSLLPLSLPSTENVSVLSTRDGTMKQLQKDIERDILVVNGIKVIGGAYTL